MTDPRPPYDVELETALVAILPDILRIPTRVDAIAQWRAGLPRGSPEALLKGRDLTYDEITVPGPAGDPDVVLGVYRRPDHRVAGPAIFHIHGGGMIVGDRHGLQTYYLDWIERHDLVIVSVEYRLAPEHPDPAPVEDCYAGLLGTAAHAADLRIDLERLLISGVSAGGGLAAGIALLARDRSGPPLAGQLLIYPMLDDRDATVSTRQFHGSGVWERDDNNVAWTALLGDRKGGPDVSIYAAPARATDLSRLPPAFIDVGSAEVFRDEDVAYASGIWAAGGRAELHVWPGGFHGFDLTAPLAAVSVAARAARDAWVRRILAL